MRILIKKEIIPNRCIRNNRMYEIFNLDKKYIIQEYILETNEDGLIQGIFLEKSLHPNCNPRTKKFCTDEKLQNKEVDKFIINYVIEGMLSCFNLDDCYFSPSPFDFSFDNNPLFWISN